MTVTVEGEGDRGVAEAAGDRERVDAGLDEVGDVGVAEVVEADPRHVQIGDLLVERR